jgi:hypothetical protein
MRTVLLVPRRAHPERDRLWAWCRARWQTILPSVPIYEGHHDEGAFNRSAAINTAARLADADGRWDVGIVIDADTFIRASQVRAAVSSAFKTGRVTWAHRRWRGISEEWTERVVKSRQDFGAEVDREDMDILVERTNPLSWSCCIAIPRAVWDDMGGFDERFVGWGFEDMAFMSLVCGLYGHERIEGDVYHLWHPRSEERIVKGQPARTAPPEYITNARLGRRYMVALRRDHGLHDRPGLPSSEEERLRDIANLQADDAKLAPVARSLGLPDWTDWWPTLPELRDGAKALRIGPSPRVTVVVRTGGEPETWPERREYLRASLASLTEHVSGPIVQRVIYSDWGREHRAELDAIAAEHGFYVAGDGHHGYTPGAARMWRYLSRRAQGDYIFGAEDDFLYREDIDLGELVDVLSADPQLAQVALLRAPAYQSEIDKGGLLGWPWEAFTPVRMNGYSYLTHRLFWTANPSLYRRSLTERAWPQKPSSERVFGEALFRDPKTMVAFWGTGEPSIEHIGTVRAGTDY